MKGDDSFHADTQIVTTLAGWWSWKHLKDKAFVSGSATRYKRQMKTFLNFIHFFISPFFLLAVSFHFSCPGLTVSTQKTAIRHQLSVRMQHHPFLFPIRFPMQRLPPVCCCGRAPAAALKIGYRDRFDPPLLPPPQPRSHVISSNPATEEDDLWSERKITG